MKSLCAICVLSVILSAAFVLKSYLMKLVYGSCKGKTEMNSKNSGHYPYQAVLMIDGMVSKSCAGRVGNALGSIDGVQAEADIFKRQAIVRMKREVSDDTLRSAVEDSGTYTVIKIERKRYV